MALPANHQELVAEAKRRANDYVANLEKQKQAGDGFQFAKIGAYIPSEAKKEQLRRLSAIQKEANEAVFDSNVQF
jgi:hypothetical protein